MENFNKHIFNILIVDDLPRNIQIAGNIIKEDNYNIYFADSGAAALQIAENNDLDLVLLDIMMPEMDGYEVCKRLKKLERTKETPVIYLTAKSDPESIIKGFKTGAADYVSKPFNGEELKARVKNHLERKYSSDRLQIMNKKLQESEKNLKELNSTKDKFFSIIAHDLKNPFSTLTGFSQLLKEKIDAYDKNKIKEFATYINTTARKGYNLLENLLEWSRAQTGRLKWDPKNINLNNIVDDNITLLKPNADKKSISVKSEMPDKTEVFADPNMVTAIIRNLVSNAIKFTKENGNISLSAKNMNNHVEISVADNGIGMNEEEKKSIFRIDQSHSKTGTSGEKGTGLGLILCKEFVEKNEGKIWLESQQDKGTVFYFTLPAKKDPSGEESGALQEKMQILVKMMIKEPEISAEFSKTLNFELQHLFTLAKTAQSEYKIKDFAQELITHAEKNQHKAFTEYGKYLMDIAPECDKPKQQKLLMLFPEMIGMAKVRNEKK